jgi:cytochrome c5
MTDQQASPPLPRGVLKLAAEALEEAGIEAGDDWAAARTVLNAARAAIERAALKRAAAHMLKLQALAYGHLCAACHGKPVSTPHIMEGRDSYRCGCGHEWKPANHPDTGLEIRSTVRALARDGVLPELPAKTGGGQ